MKRALTYFKPILICALMLIAFRSSAQKITATDLSLLKVGPATPTTPIFDKKLAVFCPTASSFNLNASPDDGAGNAFNTFEWYEVSPLGGATPITGQTAIKLPVTNATPGYHTYRVVGVMNYGNSQLCKSNGFEDFTVYVLPPLTVTATAPNTDKLKYCVDNLPTGAGAIVLTATTAFSVAQNTVGGLINPAVSDFEYIYAWYKTDLAGVKIGPALQTSNVNTYTIAQTVIGSFKYLVEVVYAVKPACVPSYNAVVTQNNTEATIIVTPKPGKPTISIN